LEVLERVAQALQPQDQLEVILYLVQLLQQVVVAVVAGQEVD
jgi:hypothetical protein